MNFWFEYTFPFNLILDLGNVSLLIIIIFFILKRYHIPNNLSLILILSCLTPLLFNGLMFDWSVFPDQSKYLRNAYFCRELNCQATSNPMMLSGIIYAFSPLLSLEGMKSVAFLNRFFLILTIIFLYLKKFDKFFLIFLIFFPGLILYSSISIRDTLVIIFSILIFYSFFEKKYLNFLIIAFLLFLLKYQTAAYIMGISFLYYLFFNIKKKLLFKIIIIISFIIFAYVLESQITGILNIKRYGFFHEAYGDLTNFENLNSMQMILSLPKSALLFFISPGPVVNSVYDSIIFLDTLIIYMFTFFIFFHNMEIDHNKSFFWLITLIFLFSLHGLIVINDGTIHRYKITILIPILFAYLYSLKKKF